MFCMTHKEVDTGMENIPGHLHYIKNVFSPLSAFTQTCPRTLLFYFNLYSFVSAVLD